ncbi:glycoside hydrolase family 2 protein [Runella aurantiaca]|uniref:Beta-galactosidase n=1 Tax=Runella aurantiaca TaxID=2282308 RepID=A0A369IBX5_9BACT|nr:glycoside hydrolase family 2 TIM barrel-domain containing protein [Runella aurantiaca]RDB07269.1 beta-galactosidase [Runella aurantiaca]
MKLSALFFLVSITAFGQYTLRQSEAIPLHGQWSFAMDTREVGAARGWYKDSYNVNGLDKVTVPHCFSVDPRYQFYTGTVWYRKSFPWQPQAGKRVILHFDAAYYKSEVWLNNQKVGTHEGGYTPFDFDITDFLKSGDNVLAISINNDTWQTGSIPGAKDNGNANDPFPGWINYGGLIRPVYLTTESEVYLENLKVEAMPDLAKGTAHVRLKARVRNASKQDVTPKLTTVISLENQPLKLIWKTSSSSIAAGQTAILEAEASLKTTEVKLWNLDEPTLYQLQASINGDTLSTNFGIRKVEVQNAQLLLNGQPIRLAGGNRVVDYPGLGSLEPDWLVEKDFRLMKEAGMEFHRLTHYTPSETFYDLADRYGMLIITEPGNWQLTPAQMDNDTIRRKFQQQFREMMERDWNHPSVIAYSVGNEYLSETPSGQRWTKDMMIYGRSLDPTRLYTFASMRLNILPAKPEDEATQYCDFVSTNTYGNHAKVFDHIHALYPDKPILISEWGTRADNAAGEVGQVSHLESVIAEIRKRPYIVGASWWSYNDYQSRHVGTAANGYRPWGLVGPERNQRPLYAAHRREMSPVTLEKVSYQAGGQGQHQLVIRVKARNDFPAYAIKKYVLKTDGNTVVIPDLQPGQSMEIKVPVRGFEKNITLEILKPTGFSVVTETFELK